MKDFKYRHLVLFIITFVSTTIAGAEWMFGRSLFFGEERLTMNQLIAAMQYSIPFLLILTVHEFGHYFTARYHKVRVTLPNYIPFWLGFLGLPSLGTMGAYIQIKDAIFSRKHYFDIGVAGPLAGFVVAIGVIWYGFTHLPPQDYIFEIHPEYEQYGLDYAEHVYDDKEGISIQLGDNLIYWFFQNYVVEDPSLLPHPNEMIHYPYLLAGYLALFFTALNLLPIGQLDGGHVTFGLFGERVSRKLNTVFFTAFIFYAGLGWVDPGLLPDISIESSFFFLGIILFYVYFLYIASASMFESKKNRLLYATIIFSLQYFIVTYTDIQGYGGWLLFAFLLGRFLGVYHPPVIDNGELSTGRKVLGWIAIIVFILSFSPRPLIIQ
jgi:membrane-associated protease RseP (regulator of RpoE activity)